jgi:hypothetical protein
MIVFIDTLFIQLRTTGNYSAIAVLHTLQFTCTHALGFSVSRSWCRAQSGAYDQIFITVWQLRSFYCGAPFLTRGRVFKCYMLNMLINVYKIYIGPLSVHAQDSRLCPSSCSFRYVSLVTWTINSNDFLCSIITPLHGPRRKYSLSIVEKACLLILCLAMDVLLLRVRFRWNVFTESLP